MNEQSSTVDRMFDQPGGQSVIGLGATGVDLAPTFTAASATEPAAGRLDRHELSEEAPAASLVGSLSAFSLSDVLSLLAATAQSGELQVVSESMDGKLWLVDGELSNASVGSAVTIGQAVFELACVIEGWFYFTVGPMSSSGQPPVPVAAVLDEVGPQVEEWREIRHMVPLEAIVNLAPTPPGHDVQIRSDQWRTLTTVGSSDLSVTEVLEKIGGDQIIGLRTLRDLHKAGLIVMGPVPGEFDTRDAESVFEPTVEHGADIATFPPPPDHTGADEDGMMTTTAPVPLGSDSVVDSDDEGPGTMAEVAIMPPPIAADPWTPRAEPDTGSDNGVA